MRNIDDICASNLSYEEKIQELECEKELASSMIEEAQNQITSADEAVSKLNDGKYLPLMIEARKYFVDRLKWEIPSSAASIGVGAYGLTNFINIIYGEMPTDIMSVEKIIAIILAASFGTTASLILAKSIVDDSINLGKYNRSIEAYQRRLKSKK